MEKNLTTEQLKALVYDKLRILNRLQGELQNLEKAILERETEDKRKKSAEEPAIEVR